MRNKRNKSVQTKAALTTDMAYMLLLILLFICVIAILQTENSAFGIASLCVIFSIMIITHFTSVTMGLIINIILIFFIFSYFLYRLLVKGEPILGEVYFWMIMSPALTVISSAIFFNVKQIEDENHKLVRRVKHFSIIDDVTELKNIQAYEMEFPIYQKIANRYHIGLLMIVWQFRYAGDLQKIIGKNNMEQTVFYLSKAMEEIFRTEDVLYILSKDPYEWGTLMLSKEEDEELLKERIKGKLDSLDISPIIGKNAPKLELRIGMHYIYEEEETALAMLKKAKSKLQYDV